MGILFFLVLGEFQQPKNWRVSRPKESGINAVTHLDNAKYSDYS